VTGKLKLFRKVVLSHLVTLLIEVVLGDRFGDYICRVDSRLLVLSRLAMCRFGLVKFLLSIVLSLNVASDSHKTVVVKKPRNTV